MEILIFILIIIFIIYSLYDKNNYRKLSKKSKVNWTFIILLLPFLGSVIYFITKMSEHKVQRS